jgi:2-oxoglutarate ferredoxin oxidoreductase subunit alpha
MLPPKEKLVIEERRKPSVPPEWYTPYDDRQTGVPPMPAFGEGYRYHVTGLAHDIRGYPTTRSDEVGALIDRLFSKISRDFHLLQWFDSYQTEDSVVTIVAYGSVARSALRAVKEARERGLKVGLLKLKVLWPFMRYTVMRFLESSAKVLVPEMNMGQLSREVKRVNQGRCEIVTLNKADGTLLSPKEILGSLQDIYP